MKALRQKSELLFDLLDTFIEEAGQPVVRLTQAFATHPIWKAGLKLALDDTLGEIALLHEGLQLVRDRIEGSTKLDEELAPLMSEMRAVTRRLQGAGDGLRRALTPPPDDDSVRWIEVRGRERSVAVSCVPLDLAPILREDLFKRLDSTIVTSATLTASSGDVATDAHRFDFLAARLGLDEPDLPPTTAVFPSPFDFATQSLLVIPSDVPAPNVDPDGHRARDHAHRARRRRGVGWRALRAVHEPSRSATACRRAAVARHRAAVAAARARRREPRRAARAAFATRGRRFCSARPRSGKGVDVPGDALRGLVIAKLPFRVPTEPVTAAHCEAIVERGGDAFAEYMVPHAALRLKQGFGRLIRTSTDRGVVVVADPRIVTKRYGRGLARGAAAGDENAGRCRAERVSAFYCSRRATVGVRLRMRLSSRRAYPASSGVTGRGLHLTMPDLAPEKSSASAATIASTQRSSATRSRKSR